MWNIMLDAKPRQWKGYPVNTDFRTGIQIYQVLNDHELSDHEKIYEVRELLFPGVEPQTPEEIQECLEWFLSGWYLDGKPSWAEQRKIYDYDVDQWRIYSAFRAQYNIDLNVAEMHYWEFMGLLSTLEECAFTRVKDIRQKKVDKKMKPEQVKALREAKKIYSLDAPDRKELDSESKEIEEEAAEIFKKLRGN